MASRAAHSRVEGNEIAQSYDCGSDGLSKKDIEKIQHDAEMRTPKIRNYSDFRHNYYVP
ncbi:MAG: hypothetical protein FWF94_03850 [Oscillospiraceae bacterium]|nr:hypothetical protein [Oscillospiraceae bacterium]